MSDLVNDAIALAESGVSVFPVGPTKAPRTERGFHDASTDPEVIRRWDWNGGGGIGAAISPGTVVIDVDPRNGGSDTIRVLRESGKTFPKTRVVRTRGGGFHYYFKVPEGALRSQLGPGVDVKRAGKGYVVVPPTPGYVLLTDGIADAPNWLIEELHVEENESAVGEASDPKYGPWENGTAYGLSALERELGRLAVAKEGERNHTLNRVTFALAQLVSGGELKGEHVLGNLEEMAERIGLDPRETKLTIASGWRAGEQSPRQAPEAPERKIVDVSDFVSPTENINWRWVDWEIDEPAPPFYLNPVIPRNAYITVYGPTEASKSMVWVALLAEASRRGLKCSVWSLENPPHTDRDRLRRLKPNHDNFRLTHGPLDLNDPRQFQAMVAAERDWGTDIVLIDTYSHAFNSRSEDGNARAIEFARRVRYLMQVVGCTVVLIDHTGYTHTEEPRDASAKRQQVDVAVLMEKNGEWQPGQPSRFSMKNKKPARFANPFLLRGEIRDIKDDHRSLEVVWTVGADEMRWE